MEVVLIRTPRYTIPRNSAENGHVEKCRLLLRCIGESIGENINHFFPSHDLLRFRSAMHRFSATNEMFTTATNFQ